jgi:hypothetical protein
MLKKKALISGAILGFVLDMKKLALSDERKTV